MIIKETNKEYEKTTGVASNSCELLSNCGVSLYKITLHDDYLTITCGNGSILKGSMLGESLSIWPLSSNKILIKR